MPLTRRDLIESAMSAAVLPGAGEYFLHWLDSVAQHDHAEVRVAPPEAPILKNYRPKFFSEEDFEALEAFCGILIPTDEFPGAKEARCALYIDYVLAAATEFAPERQKLWRTAIAALRDTGFHRADYPKREAIVEAMSKPERDPKTQHPAYFAYRLIKQENAFVFYSSRPGLIENLDYKGNSYNAIFPECNHPEHQTV